MAAQGVCIDHPGKTSPGNTYPRQSVNGRSVRVYRHLWEQTNGPVPAGMTLDHLCFNVRCINVLHLEVVTPAENARRYWDRLQPQRTTGRIRGLCIKGHDLADAWVSATGKRFCRTCHRRRSRESRQRIQRRLAA